MRTPENIVNFTSPVDKVIKQKLIRILFNDFQTSKELRSLNNTFCKLDSIEIINPGEKANRTHKLP